MDKLQDALVWLVGRDKRFKTAEQLHRALLAAPLINPKPSLREVRDAVTQLRFAKLMVLTTAASLRPNDQRTREEHYALTAIGTERFVALETAHAEATFAP